jgi:hypothetical protein
MPARHIDGGSTAGALSMDVDGFGAVTDLSLA